MKHVDLDILIPAYNAEATLEATLRSVELQTLPLTSVTLVDDGSRDRTEAIARARGIRYVRNEKNLGCAGNWNRCLALARADYVCLLHADDLLAPEWHERVQAAISLAVKPVETAYYMGAARFADKGGIIEAFCFDDTPRLHSPGGLLKQLWSRRFFGLTTSACMVYGRQVLERLGPFPGDRFPNMPDVPFHWNLLLDHPIVYDPSLAFLIRRGAPNQVGSTRRAELALGAWRAFEPVRDRVAAAVGISPARATIDYLFPYAVLDGMAGIRGQASEVPAPVLEALRAALSECGRMALAAAAAAEFRERIRRRLALRAWGGRVDELLARIEPSRKGAVE